MSFMEESEKGLSCSIKKDQQKSTATIYGKQQSNIKEKASLKKSTNNVTSSWVKKNKKKTVDSNPELKNTRADFNTLNYPEESRNKYDTVHKI